MQATLTDDKLGSEGPGVDSTWDDDELIDDDLLVEEISIDGMCGVY